MKNDLEFELTYQLALIKVTRQGPTVFTIQFSNEVPALTIEKAKDERGISFWRAVSAGNDELAAGIGKLIDAYLDNS